MFRNVFVSKRADISEEESNGLPPEDASAVLGSLSVSAIANVGGELSASVALIHPAFQRIVQLITSFCSTNYD